MIDPAEPGDAVLQFLRDRHMATLTTLRRDGSPHVCAIAFSYDAADRCARIITFASSTKARNAARGGRAAVCQVDGGRWLTLEGAVRLVNDADGVRAAEQGYASRYRDPSERPDRVAIEIAVDRMMGRV